MACQQRDHSSNSNDCCRGSLSQLMTSATVLRKVSVLLSGVTPSTCLSVSRTPPPKTQAAFCGKPCDKNSAGGYKCFHLFIHPSTHEESQACTAPVGGPAVPQSDTGVDPPLLTPSGNSTYQGGPWLKDLPGDRWKGHMMVVHLSLGLPHIHTLCVSRLVIRFLTTRYISPWMK